MTAHTEDDFDDPQASALLRRWGTQVRRDANLAPRFEAPHDLSPLHRRLDDVDAELGPSRAPTRGRATTFGLGWRLALAATVLLAATAWLVVQGKRRTPGAGGSVPRMLAVTGLSVRHAGPVYRDAPDLGFRSGERLSLSFAADGDGFATVALLDHDLKLARVGGVFGIHAGMNEAPEPFRLDEHAGTESFVVVATTEPLDAAAFDMALHGAAAVAAGVSGGHDERLQAVVRELTRDKRLTVQTFSFQHLPP